jgi:hypothetical protein
MLQHYLYHKCFKEFIPAREYNLECNSDQLHGRDLFFEAQFLSKMSRNIPLLWNLTIHYRVRKTAPLAPVLKQMSPVDFSFTVCLRTILIFSSPIHLGFQVISFRIVSTITVPYPIYFSCIP